MRSLLGTIIFKDGNSEGRLFGPVGGIMNDIEGFSTFVVIYFFIYISVILLITLVVGGAIVLGILWGLGVI